MDNQFQAQQSNIGPSPRSSFQRWLPTILGILIVLVFGGILTYQYWRIQNQIPTPTPTPTIILTPTPTPIDFSKLNKDDLLHKMFPTIIFNNGIADLSKESLSVKLLNLYLKDSFEDYFINAKEKSLLLIVNLDGVAHVGGLYHAYLGVFDKDGNLLTPSSVFPSEFFTESIHFGADYGDFNIYNCNGIKYIASHLSGCPVGGCCSDGVNVYRVNNSDFEKTSKVNDVYPRFAQKMILGDNKIVVEKFLYDTYTCQESGESKELIWNESSCRFE